MVAQEVAVLLRSGLATGALARWRTLYEIWVVASVLGDATGSVSERYLGHPEAEDLRAREDYEATWEALGRPVPDWTVDERLADAQRLRDEYGDAFLGHYGWAAPLFDGKSPKFGQLQDRADLKHWRSHYRDASHGTHANPTGVTWNLQGMSHVDTVFHGPSNAGLFEPARCTLIALTGLTTSLLRYALDLFDEDGENLVGEADTLVRQYTSIVLSEAATEVFDEIAWEQVEQEEQITAVIDRILFELAEVPGLTGEELQLRIGGSFEAVQEALDRAEDRSQIRSTRRYSMPPSEAGPLPSLPIPEDGDQ